MDAILSAMLTFPEGAFEKWLSAKLDPKAFGGWLEDHVWLDGSRPAAHGTVGDLLRALADLRGKAVSTYLEVEGTTDVEITACLSSEADIARFGQDLASALDAARALGARGSAVTGLENEQMVAVFDLGKKKTKLDVDAMEGDLVEAHGFRWADACLWLRLRDKRPDVTRARYAAEEARFSLGETTSAAEERVIEAALALDAKARESARKDPSLVAPTGKEAPLAAYYATGDALRVGLEAREPPARIFAIGVVARADPKLAERLGPALLADPSEPLRMAAIAALARSADPVVLGALLDATDPGRVAIALTNLLIEAPKALDAVLLERLASELFDPSTYPAGPLLEPELRVQGLRRERARVIGSLIADRGVKAALPTLEKIFLDPSRGAGPLRGVVFDPLVRLGGAKLEKRLGPKLQAWMVGIGLALDQDAARRAEILGLSPKEAKKDYAKFSDLSLEKLKLLIEEDFIPIEGSQNDSPRTCDFFVFMEAWPEVTAHGYAIGHPREDYRVTIEGIACDLSAVAKDRKEPLRKAFAELCEDANEVETDGDHLSAWWT